MKISQKLGARQEPRSRESHITVSWLLKSIARPILLVLIRVFEKFLLFLFPLSAAVMFLHMLGSHSKHSSVYVSLNSHWHFGILKLCFMFCGNRMQEVDVELSLVLEFQKKCTLASVFTSLQNDRNRGHGEKLRTLGALWVSEFWAPTRWSQSPGKFGTRLVTIKWVDTPTSHACTETEIHACLLHGRTCHRVMNEVATFRVSPNM